MLAPAWNAGQSYLDPTLLGLRWAPGCHRHRPEKTTLYEPSSTQASSWQMSPNAQHALGGSCQGLGREHVAVAVDVLDDEARGARVGVACEATVVALAAGPLERTAPGRP